MGDNLVFILFLFAPPLAGELLFLFLLSRSFRRTPKGTGWTRAVLVNAASILLLVGLTFCGGELYYRTVYDTTDSFTFSWLSQRWLHRYYVENDAGYRDNVQYFLNIEPGKRRVSFVGDSFTAGHGIKDVEDRFPNLIRRDQPDWDVHVLARLGADTGFEFSSLYTALTNGYQADVVVLVYNLNDVGDLMPEMGQKLDERVRQLTPWRGWLRRHSYLADLWYLRIKLLRDPVVSNYFDYVRDGYKGALWDVQKQRLTAFRNLVNANGGQLLVVTFPFLHAVGPGYKYQFIHDELSEFWKQTGVPQLDLLPLYSNLPPAQITVNRYDAHPNEYADALAAPKIEEFIKQYMTTNRPSVRGGQQQMLLKWQTIPK